MDTTQASTSNHSKKSWIDRALSFDGSKESWDSDLDDGIEELTKDQQYILPPDLVEASNSSSYSNFDGIEGLEGLGLDDGDDIDDVENENEKILHKQKKEMKKKIKKEMAEISARQWRNSFQDYFTKTGKQTPPMTIRKSIKVDKHKSDEMAKATSQQWRDTYQDYFTKTKQTTPVAKKKSIKSDANAVAKVSKKNTSSTETSKEADIMKRLVQRPAVRNAAPATTVKDVDAEFEKINERIRAARMKAKGTKQPRSNSMTIVDQVRRQEQDTMTKSKQMVQSRRNTWMHKLDDTRQRKSQILASTSTHSEPPENNATATKRISWMDKLSKRELEKLLLTTSTHSVPDTIKRESYTSTASRDSIIKKRHSKKKHGQSGGKGMKNSSVVACTE